MKDCEETLGKLGLDSWRENDDEAKMKLNARMALSIALQDTGRRLKV
jgi:hypothetical protein